MADNKQFYTFQRVPSPKAMTLEAVSKVVRSFNDILEMLSMKVYGNIQAKDLHGTLGNEIKSKVGNDTYNTYVEQTAQAISQLATKTEVTDSLDDIAGDLEALAGVVGGKTTTFWLTSEPSTAVIGDTWYQYDQGKIWRKTSAGVGMANWTDVTTLALKSALDAAGAASDLADSKIVTYRQDDKPTGGTYSVGDLWFDSNDSNKLYRWNGTDFIDAQDTHLDATVNTVTTKFTQSANAIRIAAGQSQVNNFGEAVDVLTSEIEVTPGRISTAVTNKSVHVLDTPPSGADLYAGKIWAPPSLGEQLMWKAIVANSARSYAVTGLTGTSVPFNDLSDSVGLSAVVKAVAAQASGTPTPTAPLAITGKSAITVRKTGENLFDPGATVTTSGITKTVNSDGSVTLNGTATADVFFNMDLPNAVPGNLMLSANNPVANANVSIRGSTAAGVQVYGLALSSTSAVSAAFSGDVRRVVIRVANGTTLSSFALSPQLEMGSAATAFEAYHKTDYTLTPDATLYGLTGYEDEIGTDGHVYYKCAYVRLDNTYTASNITVFTNTVRAQISKTGMPVAPSDNTPAICSHFPRAYDTSDTVHFYKTANSINLYIPKSVLSTYDATGVLAWLNTAKPQFVYQMATQVNASIAPVNISGFDGANVVTSDGASVSLSYVGSGWKLLSGSARRLYAGANQVFDENGLEITQTSLDGAPVDTKFVANTQKYGIFRSSDDKLLQGAKTLPDGTVVGATGAIVDPDGDDNASYRMRTDGSGVWFDLVHATHTGTGPTDIEDADLENPPTTAWDKLVSLGANVVPNWVPGAYGDEIFVTLKAIFGAVFALYGSSIILSALDSGGSSTCGLSLDADGDGRIQLWGAGFVPTSNGGISFGSPTLGINYYYGTHTSIQSTSDERAKHDMRPLEPDVMLRFIMALDPSWYRLNSNPEDLMAGFKAQQFMEAMKAAGIPLDFSGFNGKDPDHLALDYCQVVAPLVSVVQTQQKRIEAQDKRIAFLEKRLDDLIRVIERDTDSGI